MKEFVVAVADSMAEDAGVEEGVLEFALVDEVRYGTDAETGEPKFKQVKRVLTAYPPSPNQLAFLMATMGRGQSDASRFGSYINVMLNSLRGDDKDYFEERLLESDPRRRIPMEQVEEIFMYLTEEWFARPSESQSDSSE